MKTLYLAVIVMISLGSSSAYSYIQMSCEQMETEIISGEELVESRTVNLSDVPSWYLGIPGLMRFGATIEPILLETDRVLGPEFRVDLTEKTPQFVYNTAFALAYPVVMASHVPGDLVKIPYFALTKSIIEKRLNKLKERYQQQCEND